MAGVEEPPIRKRLSGGGFPSLSPTNKIFFDFPDQIVLALSYGTSLAITYN
jgi:hypothetical protein